MKKNIILKRWVIPTVIIIACSCLIILIRYNEYHKIEKEYIDVATYIYTHDGFENAENIPRIIITRNEINFLLEDSPLDDKCNGYVIITLKNKKPQYKAFITCNKYKTKDFNRSLLD